MMITSIDEGIGYLKSKEIIHILRIQTTLLNSIQNFMIDKGFIQLMPVITASITDPLGPDPGSSVLFIPKIRYYNQELALTQSMILQKQLALLSGAKKVFIMSPNIRLENEERGKSGKHLFEFTQMDFEIADGTMEDVMTLIENLLCDVFKCVKEQNAEDLIALGRNSLLPLKPFPKYTTHELEEKYGSEWERGASLDHSTPFWATCFQREFYDREDPENPGHYCNYDLYYPEGFEEGLSGGEREFDYKRILKRIQNDKLDLSDYSTFLDIAQKGELIPSAGAGLGIERLLRFTTGTQHIGDVQLFRRVPGEKVFT